ncbi:GntR family transcriptional regulator [Salicibibacter cibarius]|uniref:GntR family transcriptional regulator n=1 Tax=Salicibibacter cibarius TaxID=2743000 RepID=A0A7T7CB76_9BACI|nr:GntR family transcriptional regulator [Salicibibacter cibarius]QQK75514.1 GntR family transcriptional regulator [Salicibibacter cibarius]
MEKQTMDNTNRIPLYQQIKELILQNIQNRIWKPGEYIPSEIKLLDEFNVSRTTLRQAISSLVQEGILDSQQGKGTKVNTYTPINRIQSSTIRFEEQGDKFTSKILRMDFSLEMYHAKKQLNKPENEKIFLYERVRFADGTPIAILQFYTTESIGRLFMTNQSDTKEPYAIIEENNVSLKHATDWVTAVNASTKEADILGVRGGESLVQISRLSSGINDMPIEYSRTIYRADKFNYSVTLANY